MSKMLGFTSTTEETEGRPLWRYQQVFMHILPSIFVHALPSREVYRLRNTPNREDEMRWNENSCFRLLGCGLAQLPFKNKSCRYKNWRPNSSPTDFRSFVGTDRKSVSVPPALLVYWFETNDQNSCAAGLKLHEAPDSNSCVTCVTYVKLHETAISKLMRCMPQSALNCCTRKPAVLVY